MAALIGPFTRLRGFFFFFFWRWKELVWKRFVENLQGLSDQSSHRLDNRLLAWNIFSVVSFQWEQEKEFFAGYFVSRWRFWLLVFSETFLSLGGLRWGPTQAIYVTTNPTRPMFQSPSSTGCPKSWAVRNNFDIIHNRLTNFRMFQISIFYWVN